MSDDPLSFAELRAHNAKRCNEVFHPIVDWSPFEYIAAVAGEVGEAIGIAKRVRRGEFTMTSAIFDNKREERVVRDWFAEELADAVIYLDLAAARVGIDLGAAIRRKFNRVSEERGSRFFL